MQTYILLGKDSYRTELINRPLWNCRVWRFSEVFCRCHLWWFVCLQGVNKVLEYYRLIHFRNIFALFRWCQVHFLAYADILLKLQWWKSSFKLSREFPGFPVVRTQCFHCWGLWFNPWLGNQGPTSHAVWTRNKF